MIYIVTLPWPPKELSPNARVHWAKKAKAVKSARDYGFIQAKGSKITIPNVEKLHVWWAFYPPDKRKRDDDNLLASCKAFRDGIADALGVNDHKFISHIELKDEVVRGGVVVVKITDGSEIHG